MQHTSYAKSLKSVKHRPAENCSVGLRLWCILIYCLQPCMVLFVFVLMAATLYTLPFLKVIIIIYCNFHCPIFASIMNINKCLVPIEYSL